MKHFASALIVLAIGLSSTPAASASLTKRTFTIEGQKITATVKAFRPAIAISRKSVPTDSAAQTYLNYQFLLSEAKIKEAAELTVAPDATVNQQTAYLDRLGGASAFRKKMSGVYEAKLTLTHVLELGNSKMLLGQHPDHGLFATFLNCTKASCLITDDLKDPDVEKLGRIFNAYREKKLTL